MSGPECCSNPPTLNPSGGAGHVEKLGGLNAYVTGPFHSKLAILLVSDVFGFEAPNLRKLADKVAAAGYYVVVPDFLNGDPYAPEDVNAAWSAWLKDHGPDKGFEDAKPVIEALKSKGVSAIGAAGFCWGGKVVVELAKSGIIHAAVLLHPSFVTVDDIMGVNIPICVLGAEIDRTCPPEVIKQFEEVLNAKPAVDCHVKVFPKVSHGWSVRYDNEDAEAVKVAEEAHKNLLEWFAKELLNGDPYAPEDANRPLPVWLKDHAPDNGFQDAKHVVEALKSKGVSAIGAAGFCWGAKAVLGLAKSGLITAAVLLHPAFITIDDIKDVNVPIAVLGAEIDKISPPELIQQFEQVLNAKPGLDCHFKIFPKVSHGWSVRYDNEDAEAVKVAEEAHKNLLEWFAKYVK